jgi:hypothetical protein
LQGKASTRPPASRSRCARLGSACVHVPKGDVRAICHQALGTGGTDALAAAGDDDDAAVQAEVKAGQGGGAGLHGENAYGGVVVGGTGRSV